MYEKISYSCSGLRHVIVTWIRIEEKWKAMCLLEQVGVNIAQAITNAILEGGEGLDDSVQHKRGLRTETSESGVESARPKI